MTKQPMTVVEMGESKRKPDFRVGAMRKLEGMENKGNVGAAWLNEDGTIHVVLDPWIHLPRQDGDLLITLFPVKEKKA
ncbi:MAG: hypothetical protein V4563_14975 [Pseudomonadota bacterium]